MLPSSLVDQNQAHLDALAVFAEGSDEGSVNAEWRAKVARRTSASDLPFARPPSESHCLMIRASSGVILGK